jgi:hypothetical protein
MNVQITDWPDRLFATLKRAGIRQVGYVPDAGHARLIDCHEPILPYRARERLKVPLDCGLGTWRTLWLSC